MKYIFRRGSENTSGSEEKFCLIFDYPWSTYIYYVFHDRVTLFFADNFSMECQIIVKFWHNFF